MGGGPQNLQSLRRFSNTRDDRKPAARPVGRAAGSICQDSIRLSVD